MQKPRRIARQAALLGTELVGESGAALQAQTISPVLIMAANAEMMRTVHNICAIVYIFVYNTAPMTLPVQTFWFHQ